MPTLRVALPGAQAYPIKIQDGILAQIGPELSKALSGKRIAVISHPRIARLYAPSVMRSLSEAGLLARLLLVPEGETAKSLGQAEKLISRLIALGMDRSSALVALGGGVIGDLTGLVAALYMRGIAFVQIPTTLLAQVDSAVGGKVAVNHPAGKNLIGQFYQPQMVLTDPGVLRTLHPRQWRAGMAEIIKSAIIRDAEFFAGLEARADSLIGQDTRAMIWAIRQTCAIKAEIVAQDEKEKGVRAILNFGHTLAHALETYHNYKNYLHGEAVAIGMVAAALLSHEIFGLAAGDVQRIQNVLQTFKLPVHGQGEDVSKIVRLMQRDKKAKAGRLYFVLTPRLGDAKITNKIRPFSVIRTLKQVLG